MPASLLAPLTLVSMVAAGACEAGIASRGDLRSTQSPKPTSRSLSLHALDGVSCFPRHRGGRTYETVQIEFHVPQTTVSLENNVRLRVLFVGTFGGRKIRSNFSFGRDLFFVIRDAQGNVVKGTPLNGRVYERMLPPLDPARIDYTEINNGDIHGAQFKIPVSELVPGPGTYRATAAYQSIIPRSMATDPEVVVKEDGICESKPVELTVTE